MSGFQEYLHARLATGGFSTEDVLGSFLPLAREVVQAHAEGKVAPLEGLDALCMAGAQLWFEESKRQEIRTTSSAIRRVEESSRAAVEIVSEARWTSEIGEGHGEYVDLAIGSRDAEVTRPVYLPGYVTWEHLLGHHDPLTDIFSLGMILASLACGLDFTEPDDLRRFVASRRNLFALSAGLHPVLARAIVRMTELDRHRRVQDLRALVRNLENYREQEVDFDLDLARVPDFKAKDSHDKQQVVLGKLRERLFEVSRRNRLLHFRSTMQSVNLTQASVPLCFDVRNVRAEQILVWDREMEAAVAGGKTISLNKYLNFAEALYLPSLLDHITAEARRDRAEFGFAQLRLVACFLHWANLKEKPAERFESPLVLVPVEVKKKKGIRDVYTLQAITSEAEINPVVRHLFKQLYDVDLPETIDLTQTSLDDFYQHLARRIEASEPAVSLTKIDRPRIALIHEKARRKLEQYRRRARLAGRGVRSYRDLDYSYDPVNYHPLGITLFSALIRPPQTRLQSLVEERPRPRSFAAPEPSSADAELDRTFFSLEGGGEENPYAWSFDLCSVTLGNFKYRKMSLVRDYELLANQPRPNPAFESTFSLVPRALDRKLPAAPPVEDRYDVVPCDPTQAAAIEEAHAGGSYIIQGPPGTGKSQTITNLIADYVAQGKRVLFVCEKRAAIDVVYARLRQRGLEPLCSLIHDSQADKREFVLDLKQVYERAISDGQQSPERDRDQRQNLLKRLTRELRSLEQFDAAMQMTAESSGLPVRRLLARCVELLPHRPSLSDMEKERLPGYAAWREHRERIEAYAQTVREFQPDGILAMHPLRILSPKLAQVDRPLETITAAAQAAKRHFAQLERILAPVRLPAEARSMLRQARQLVDYCRELLPVCQAGQLSLLDPKSSRWKSWKSEFEQLQRQQDSVAKARESTAAWREKLPPADVAAALEQAEAFEKSSWSWLKPAWWRFRRAIQRAYDFQAHLVRPRWSQVLAAIEREYAEQAKLEWQRYQLAQKFDVQGDIEEVSARLLRLRSTYSRLPAWLKQLHVWLAQSSEGPQIVARIAEAEQPLSALITELDRFTAGHLDRPLDRLGEELSEATAAIADLPQVLRSLKELSRLPESLAETLRSLPLTTVVIEAAIADRGLEEFCREDRSFAEFSGAVRDRHADRLQRLYADWLESNAGEIRRRVTHRFLENVRSAGLPAGQLSEDEKDWKKRYTRGRRELEHEFGKTMRFKSIRDLVSGDSGEVVKDLKPVWLMSPLSVSDTLPLDDRFFDVVIFDEASQITLEEAVPSLFRARQAIVVGDEMQLPPTDFFSTKRADEEEELLIEQEGELVQYDLDANSFLSHAARNLPATMLGWHYRSRSESLISFSNWTFYDGRLLTVPEETLAAGDHKPLSIAGAEDGRQMASELLSRPISFHHLPYGVYDKRRNRAEAEYIAELVRELLVTRAGLSIGIIAFSEAQQEEIELALTRLAQGDAKFAALLDAEREREIEGQFVGLLVKNLENIQGDERDVVILSVCYGPGPNRKMLMNFGPINKSGGEKRLNVAFSRAKLHMAVVSSIRFGDITNDYNDGANCLKSYLRYAEAVSAGDAAAAQRVLRGMSRWQEAAEEGEKAQDHPVARQLAEALTEQGFLVDRAIGQSHFRCDLAVRRPGESAYRLAILLDNDAYYEQPDFLARDVMRPRLLRDFGWNVAFVLAKDWYQDRQGVLSGLLHRLGEEAEPT